MKLQPAEETALAPCFHVAAPTHAPQASAPQKTVQTELNPVVPTFHKAARASRRHLPRMKFPQANRKRLALVTLTLLGSVGLRWSYANREPVYPVRHNGPQTWIARGLTNPMKGVNAAHFYAAAADLYQPQWATMGDKSQTVAQMRESISHHTETLRLLREGLKYNYQGEKSYWIKIVGPKTINTPPPNYVVMRDMARLLATEDYLKASQGDHVGAMSAGLDVLRFGTELAQDDPKLMEGMMASHIAGIGTGLALESVSKLSATQAREALNRLEALRPQPRMSSILEAEKFYNLTFVQESFRGNLGNFSTSVPVLLHTKQGLLDSYSQMMDRLILKSGLPYQQSRNLQEEGVFLPPVGCDNFSGAYFSLIRQQERLTLLKTRLALHAYRLEHGGAAPRALEALVEAGYLKTLPIDPFSADGTDALRYKDGEVWSVGRDGKDSGGAGDDTLEWK